MFKATIVASTLLAVAIIGYTTYANTNLAVKSEFSSEIVDTHNLWTMKHAKVYATETEHSYRLSVFAANLKKIQEHNASGKSWTMGLNKFADLTQEEMQRQYTGLRLDLAHGKRLLEGSQQAPLLNTDSLPDSFDWREKGAVTRVKDQGQCGSCWAFGTVANIEGQNFIQNKKLLSFAEQELVDCDNNDNGCNGGLPSNAYKWMVSNKFGLEAEGNYPYTAKDGSCQKKSSKMEVYISDWKQISTDEDQIAAALINYGPLAIGLNANSFQTYNSGILDPWFCNPYGIDHAVTLVGWGSENGKNYWKIKNSWGPSWGEEGYIRIVRGKGKCGLNRMVTSAIVAKD